MKTTGYTGRKLDEYTWIPKSKTYLREYREFLKICYYVEKSYSVDDFCYSCKDANECVDLSDDQGRCESTTCTSQFGKVCSYSSGVCNEVGDYSSSGLSGTSTYDERLDSYTANEKLIAQTICEAAEEYGMNAEAKKLLFKLLQLNQILNIVMMVELIVILKVKFMLLLLMIMVQCN